MIINNDPNKAIMVSDLCSSTVKQPSTTSRRIS